MRYEVTGALQEVLICHCEECRRWHGHVSATAAADRRDLQLLEQRGLRWIKSPLSDAGARRGFCRECGSSLFWDSPGLETISIAAGTLDPPTGLHVASHWYVSQAGDYYEIPDDGLPHHERSGEGELV
ncbi:MAG TPA: GFA family protein [Solirubrobacteraceae bacterium]|nr:GFA family protein [Solirubrobacteraceae bacterium]